VYANPIIMSLNLDVSSILRPKAPPNNPIAPMPQDVMRVYGPTPKSKSLVAIPRKPAAKPNTGPPIIPLAIDRNATGLTFGGPPARIILVADIVAERQASIVRTLVRCVDGKETSHPGLLAPLLWRTL